MRVRFSWTLFNYFKYTLYIKGRTGGWIPSGILKRDINLYQQFCAWIILRDLIKIWVPNKIWFLFDFWEGYGGKRYHHDRYHHDRYNHDRYHHDRYHTLISTNKFAQNFSVSSRRNIQTNATFVSQFHSYTQYWLFNLSKPTGHVTHHQFNIQQLYALPTLYLCVLYLSENKQRLVPLTA